MSDLGGKWSLQAGEGDVAGRPHKAARWIFLPIHSSKCRHRRNAIAAVLSELGPTDTLVR